MGYAMNNASSLEYDSARAILSTYNKVHDTAPRAHRFLAARSHKKTKVLEAELRLLQEKYTTLKQQLNQQEQKVADLQDQLIEKTNYIIRLEEDFENALLQMGYATNKIDG